MTYKYKSINELSIKYCINCGVNYKTMAGSKLHKCSVVNGILKEYDCQLCDESFACESRRQKHELVAHGIDGRTWICNECDEEFLNEDDFRLHNKQKHDIPPSKKIKENQGTLNISKMHLLMV